MRARWIFVLAALFVSTASRADDVDLGVAAARQHFAEGVKRFQEGDFEGARVSFRRADQEHHAAITVYNIARAEERLGHPQLAVDAYEAYLLEAGEDSEYSPAAALAIVQIKGRSSRIRVETHPPGARVFIDGSALVEMAPTTWLVAIGRHHIVIEGEGWRDEADVDALEPSRVSTTRFTRPPLPDTNGGPKTEPLLVLPPVSFGPDQFILGVEFAIVPYGFLASPDSHRPATTIGVTAGGVLDLGYALTDRVEIMGRALGAVGSEGTPFTSLYAAGVAASYRVLPFLWLGAGFLGGRADSNNDSGVHVFSTDLVFSPMLEVSYAVLTKPYGQWLFSAKPAFFIASPGDNSAFYIPLSFGLRTY